MRISAAEVKALRAQTGAGVMDCKRALEEAGGDPEQAKELLRQWGLATAAKVRGRVASQGLIETYIHAGGRIGAMVEVNCETDFVARTEAFRSLAHELAMQVAATNPRYLSPEEMPEDPDPDGDPAEVCLLLQPYIRDQGKEVQELVQEAIAKVGENIHIRRFVRFELGH